MSDWKKQRCGTCVYWCELAAGAKKGPTIVGEPKSGECRHGPVGVTALPTPNGMVARITEYPLPTENHPACSLHEPVLQIMGMPAVYSKDVPGSQYVLGNLGDKPHD